VLVALCHYFTIPGETHPEILLRKRSTVFSGLGYPLGGITHDDVRSVLPAVPRGMLSTALFGCKERYFRHNLDLFHRELEEPRERRQRVISGKFT